MACQYCNKPVVLVPSAAERAKRFGGKASDYTAMFPDHAACAIKHREQETVALMRRITAERQASRVSFVSQYA